METQVSNLRTKAAVCEELRISARALEIMVKQDQFPPPVRIGKCVYWSKIAVQNWYRHKFEEQESWVSPVGGFVM